MGKSTISMAIFNSKLLVHQKVPPYEWGYHASHDEDMEDFTSPKVEAWTWKGFHCDLTEDGKGVSHPQMGFQWFPWCTLNHPKLDHFSYILV